MAATYGYAELTNSVPAFWKEKYEREAAKFWDKFYANTKGNFFKDRHWLLREFPGELTSTPERPLTVLEVGSGTGSSVFPLLETDPSIVVHAFDFSRKAIEILKANPSYAAAHAAGRCFAEVCDWTSQPLPHAPESIDVALVTFVLSAMAPEHMAPALARLLPVIKPGGVVIVRDYASGDMAQQRFESEWEAGRGGKQANKLGERRYVRGDGTQSYFFTEAELTELLTAAGFEPGDVRTVEAHNENRKLKEVRERLFVQGCFRKSSSTAASTG
eukprot:TRINITY_DN9257_c0_g1_i1.p1 TRINITY_DN9257_c0_g1~~TRINITY_DN9257_c0_g1_i1.p1  ORF type:complete len:273 (-),score=97.74 TRINITY_DN9257_c0_g1_i1:7-825(-)